MRKKKEKYEPTFCWYNSNLEKEPVTRTNLAKHSNFILSEVDIKNKNQC
ncbi:unknown [Clostridium sp. CAG:354]|nr:unknown [Clostridium sp. CAG:354]HIT23089.1 hypothetical protein [Candidatus Faecimonas intestinavium]